MSIEDLRSIALKLPGTTEDIKWDFHLCFNVGSKMYLITSPDLVPPNASFKVDEDEYEALLSRPGFTKRAYLSKHFWVQAEAINKLSLQEWEKLIHRSYELIASKLTIKLRKELGLL